MGSWCEIVEKMPWWLEIWRKQVYRLWCELQCSINILAVKHDVEILVKNVRQTLLHETLRGRIKTRKTKPHSGTGEVLKFWNLRKHSKHLWIQLLNRRPTTPWGLSLWRMKISAFAGTITRRNMQKHFALCARMSTSQTLPLPARVMLSKRIESSFVLVQDILVTFFGQ